MAEGAQDFIPRRLLNGIALSHCLTHAIERSMAEERSRYNDRRFRALIENALDGTVIIDTNGSVIYESPANKRVFGYEEGEATHTTSLDFLHPDDRQNTIEIISRAIQHPGVPSVGEARVRYKDDSWHHVEATATSYLHDPAVGGIVINARDITERKRAEEEFQHEMEFYKGLIEHAMDGLIVLGADGTLVYQSPAARRQFGAATDENTGHQIFDFIHPEDIASVAKTFADVAMNPGSSARITCRGMLSDGTWHCFEATGHNSLSDPMVRGLVGVTRDITDRKSMEEAVQKSQHELRQAMQKLQQVLNERSTPVIQVWNNVLALPLIGAVDNQRAQQTMSLLLKTIVDTQSELVILDVTGVPSMDTTATNHLVRTVRSASMLGAQCVLTGMKPELAHAVIELDLDISRFIIKRDMQEGLQWALEKMGYQPASIQSPTTEATVTYQPSEAE